MKIVIAGGTGLLGTSLTNLWANQGHELFVLTRKNLSNIKSSNSAIHFVTWNPLQTGDWIKELEGADVFINLVGQSLASGFRWTKGLKHKLLESRTKPTQTLAQTVNQLNQKPKVFVQISGVNYYDYSFESQDESSPLGPGFLSLLCQQWEDASKPVEDVGVQRLIIRLAPVIAKQSLLIRLLRLPYRLFAGGRYGLKGDQWFSWISIDDFTGFIDHAMKNNLSGVYNLSSPEPLQNKDMNSIIGRTLKRPWFFPVPSFVLKIVLGQKSELLLKSIRVVSQKIPETGYVFKTTSFENCFKNEMSKKKN